MNVRHSSSDAAFHQQFTWDYKLIEVTVPDVTGIARYVLRAFLNDISEVALDLTTYDSHDRHNQAVVHFQFVISRSGTFIVSARFLKSLGCVSGTYIRRAGHEQKIFLAARIAARREGKPFEACRRTRSMKA